jgi:hypothetical protein
LAVDFTALKTELVEVTRRRVEQANSRMTGDLKRGAPKNTGELARTTGVEVVSVSQRSIRSVAAIDVSYGEYVVQGTRPHIIRAKRGVLRFYWPKAGRVVYFRSVKHPGTKPDPFFTNVINRWADYLGG